jgi:hypothetical protein
MVLVDTSVWLRFFANRSPYSLELDALLAAEQAAGHELVYGELLCGDAGGGRKLLREYEQIKYAKTIAHAEVVEFVLSRNLYGRGVGWIDLHLLASALVDGMKLWTADTRLAPLATEFGISHQMSAPGAYIQ